MQNCTGNTRKAWFLPHLATEIKLQLIMLDIKPQYIPL